MRRAAFWTAVGSIVYTYVGFPVLLAIRAGVAPRPWRREPIEPTVSLIVVAHNEAAGMEAKLANIAELDYPPECLEVLIASDGSDDGTDEIVRRHEPRAWLLALPRYGKAAALNAAIAQASGEILVFSDANSMYRPDAIRSLVRNFADESVGGVAGDQRYRDDADADNRGEVTYWEIDRVMKLLESRAGNVISATGAIYAIRASLAVTVPPDVTDDFYLSVATIRQGARLVFEPDAIAYEPAKESHGAEFSRKVRIMTRGLTGVKRHAVLLDPRRAGFYAVQLLTHKVLRRLVFVPLVISGLSATSLARRHRFYALVALLQIAGWASGIAGLLLRGTNAGRARPLALPSYFILVNVAAAKAAWNVARGRSIDRWNPGR
jgi:cellulose synthase/poly-beta-1,6-N-acetylglucosamine synthase-like glycosyltransferase